MRRLAREIDGLEEPAVEKIAEEQKEDPFQVLVATMLSAQTRDAVTHAASLRLFKAARTPRTYSAMRCGGTQASSTICIDLSAGSIRASIGLAA